VTDERLSHKYLIMLMLAVWSACVHGPNPHNGFNSELPSLQNRKPFC